VARAVVAGLVLGAAWWVVWADGFSLTRLATSVAVLAAVLIALDTA
jgi:hypothetical protein